MMKIYKDMIKIVAGGDVQFDSVVRGDPVVSDLNSTSRYQRILYRILDMIGYEFNIISLRSFPQTFIEKTLTEHQKTTTLLYDFLFKDENDKQSFPFSKISQILKNSDITFVNLETPLAKNCRVVGAYSFLSDPIFARGLSNAGVNLVSIANNHMFNAGEKGLLDTIKHLEDENIKYVGGGKTLKDARTPVIFNVKGTKIAFLGYTQYCNHNFTSAVGDERAGILPFSLSLITEDIKAAKKKSDLVCISLHWGIIYSQQVHSKAIKYAHEIIDAGADVILGHHPHVPQGIEIYKNKPIFYSFGNFIFRYNRPSWQDNFLARIHIQKNQLKKIEILPISGKGSKLYQPELLSGNDAKKMLLRIQKLSSKLNTTIEIGDNKGKISLKFVLLVSNPAPIFFLV
jgi:poly-gamma-glutamate synthesis protein (capsule biosynthesis protein)